MPGLSVIWSLCTVVTAAVSSLGTMIAARFVFGLAQAGLVPNSAKVVKDWFPVAARGHPADHVLFVERRKRQKKKQFFCVHLRGFHHGVVRKHLLLSTCVHLLRYRPEIFLIIKYLRVGHVVDPVHGGLNGKKVTRISDMIPQGSGHFGDGTEKGREYILIGLYQRILFIRDIKLRLARIRVNDHLDRIPNIVDGA